MVFQLSFDNLVYQENMYNALLRVQFQYTKYLNSEVYLEQQTNHDHDRRKNYNDPGKISIYLLRNENILNRKTDLHESQKQHFYLLQYRLM